MDSFINLAKQGFETYERSQTHGNVSKTGGAEFNRPDHRQDQQQAPLADVDEDEVVNRAAEHGSGDNSLFSSAMGFIKSNSGSQNHPVDEEHVQRAHDQAYNQGNTSSMSADSLGGAAAMQAFKMFTSGGSGGGRSAGGGMQTQLISMAMAEASKLFDKNGGASSGNKQDAVNGAAMTVMKLLVQSKFSGTTGGSNSGGLGSLLSLASKFA